MTYLKLLIGPLLLAVIVAQLNLTALLNAIRDFGLLSVAAAALISLLGTVVSALRWRLFIPEQRFALLLRLSFVGQLYAVLLPGQLAGEAVKAYRITKGRSEKPRLVASVVVDRVIGTVALLLLGTIGLWLSPTVSNWWLSGSLGVVLAATVLSLLALRISPAARWVGAACDRLRSHGPRLERLAQAVLEFCDVWREFVDDRLRLATAMAMGLFFQCMAVAIYVVLSRDLGIEIAIADWLWIAAIVSLAIILPVSIAGIGLRDGALIGALAYLGVSGERAIALAFALLVLGLLGALVGWLVEIGTTDSGEPPRGPDHIGASSGSRR